jgi:aspartate aminotransferase-like enzyme
VNSEPGGPQFQLRVPGPTPVPPRIVDAMSVPMINHRGPAFAELIAECKQGLRWAFQTENEVLLFPASGTGGLEAAVQNLTSPAEPALFVSVGSFGDRFAQIGEAYGVDVIRLEYPWGHGAAAQDIGQALDDNPAVRCVFVTHNETSTGVANDIAAIAAEVKGRGKLLAVDGVSSIGAIDLPVDRLAIDVAITASQKGWMLPPGATFISVSEAAFDHARETKSPRFYFDFHRERDYEAKGQTLTTPPVSILFGLRETLKAMRDEGLSSVFARHTEIARGLRAAAQALELELFADPRYFSNTVTAVKAPHGDPELNKRLTATLRDKYRLEVAGGQGKLQGQIFRIGHLGDVSREDARQIAARLEQCLIEIGYIDAAVGAVDALDAAMAEPAAAASTSPA